MLVASYLRWYVRIYIVSYMSVQPTCSPFQNSRCGLGSLLCVDQPEHPRDALAILWQDTIYGKLAVQRAETARGVANDRDNSPESQRGVACPSDILCLCEASVALRIPQQDCYPQLSTGYSHRITHKALCHLRLSRGKRRRRVEYEEESRKAVWRPFILSPFVRCSVSLSVL